VRKVTGSSEDVNVIEIFCSSDENEGILTFTFKTNSEASLHKNNNELVQNLEHEKNFYREN